MQGGFPTDHITWASRGWFGTDAEALEAKGFNPVSAPGPGEGKPYSSAFRRKGAGVFAVKGAAGTGDPHLRDEVFNVVCALGLRSERVSGTFTAGGGSIRLLDGQLSWFDADYGFSGLPTMDLYGNRALRLVCRRLGLHQPRQFPDEELVPTPMELEVELLEQLHRAPGEPSMKRLRMTGRGIHAFRSRPASPPETPDDPRSSIRQPCLSSTGLAFVGDLLALRSTSEFMVIMQDYDGPDSIDSVVEYLKVHHPALAAMVSDIAP